MVVLVSLVPETRKKGRIQLLKADRKFGKAEKGVPLAKSIGLKGARRENDHFVLGAGALTTGYRQTRLPSLVG